MGSMRYGGRAGTGFACSFVGKSRQLPERFSRARTPLANECVFTYWRKLLEAEHAKALAPYLAKRAAFLPEVCRFREEKLAGHTLETTEQIVAYLRREMGYLPKEEYEDLEWALTQIPSHLDADEEEELKDLVGGWENRGLESQARHRHENFRRAVRFDSMAWSYEPPEQFPYGIMHLIRDKSGRTLEDLGLWLVSLYPWPLRDAIWFVLTGEPPEVTPLAVERDRSSGMYTLTFTPWISEKTIRDAYRSLQSGDNRPLGYKSLSAFRFVDMYTEPRQTPKWAELTRRWNQENPDDKFTDRSALRRAYERAEARLASSWANSQEDTTE